jgi:hypothetical protein
MKTDNYIKVLLTSIVILLGFIVVKDIDLPPKAHADLLGNNSKYQVECGSSTCFLLNSQSGIVKALTLKDIKDKDTKSKIHEMGQKPDF